MRKQVGIIGGGPSGLLPSRLLHRAGIDTVTVERRPRAHVLAPSRAGVLEWGSVEMHRTAGIGERMDREGRTQRGVFLSARNRGFRVDVERLTGKRVMVRGRTEVTRDLYASRDAIGGKVIDAAEGVSLHLLDTNTPFVTCIKDGTEIRIDRDLVAGCDGSHGVCRKAIPAATRRGDERVHPFGWLGVLPRTPPASEELICANHERGFALCSMRNESLSRDFIQVPRDTLPGRWSDTAVWDELRRRIPDAVAEAMITGPTIETTVAPLRSFVTEPMRWGRLFLPGDAAHIVPPTGEKGLNPAIGDVRCLWQGLVRHFDGDSEGIDRYAEMALARVWRATRFSWWFTSLMHRFPDQTPFDQMMQESEPACLQGAQAAQAALAEHHAGDAPLKIATLGEVQIHWRKDGDPTGAPLLFANSLGTDLRLWDGVVPLLPAGLRLIRYDLRGHGLSACPPGPYSMGALVTDAERLLDQIGLRDCVVVGLSIGGMIAQGLAVKRLDLVRGMVLSNTAARIGTRAMWDDRIAAIRAGGIEALADAVMERWFSKPFRATPALTGWRNMLTRQPVEGYIGCAAAIAGTDFYATTATLTLPTLAIAGSEDGSTPPDLVRETADLVRGARFHLIRGAGHLPCVERPAEFAATLTAFLEEIGHV